MSEKKNNNQLIYVEPNLENSFKDYDEHGLGQQYAIAPNLEDFCISVDLEVEVRGREVIGSGQTDNKVMVMSWSNSQDGSKVSFMQGTTINFNNSKGSSGGYVDSLTTSYTDIFYTDIKDNGTNEMFGISSIDIDYNNYFVPQVTIQFVDIRGVSLFAPEQMAHNASVNGMGGVATSDMAGSFFKCFFTFPYPKFRLSVKGIYGQPVAYELTCSDFRATFDSSTGNFGAKATFIGYAFSLLNDVTLNVLAVAPLSDYLGREYWESKLNTTFTVNDSNFNKVPMKTLTEIINAIKNAKDDVGKLSNDNPACVNQIKLSAQLESISKVELTYTNFINSLITNAQKRSAKISTINTKLHTTFLLSDNKGLLVLSNDEKDTIDSYVDNSLYEPLLTAIAEYNNANGNILSQNIPNKPEGNVYKVLISDGKTNVRLLTTSVDKNSPQAKIISKALSTDKVFSDDINSVLAENDTLYDKVLNSYNLGFIYTDNGLVDKIAEIKKNTTHEITKNEQEVASFKNETYANSIGFIPNVENLTKIMMAHLETLMYMLYTTANKVGSRSVSSMGINTSDTDINVNATNVPPFPKITNIKWDSGKSTDTSSGNKKIVDSWIGKCSGNVPERDLIHGLLNGVGDLRETINKAVNDVRQTDTDGNVISTSTLIPLTPLDMLLGGNPYGNTIDFSNISDFVGRVVIRMHQVLGLTSFNDKDWVTNANLLGKADARNFYHFFSHPSDEFIRRINMQDFTADFMLDIAGNSPKESIQKEKQQNKWAWDGDDTKSYAISTPSTQSHSTRFLNVYKVRDVGDIVNKVIPVQTISFKEAINDMKVRENLTGTIMPNSLINYVTTSDKLSSSKTIESNPNIFKVDDDYTKYDSFVKQINLDSDNMSGITKNFKCVYDPTSYKEYYEYSDIFSNDATSFFGKKYVNTPFNNEKGNRILLPTKRSLHEINSTDDIFTDDLYSASDDNVFTYMYQGGKKVKRDLGYGDLFNDLSQASNYTIPSFNGLTIANNKRVSLSIYNNTCLFGQYGYYLQDSQLVKALLFLSTLKIDYNNYIEKLISSDEGIFLAPRACSLYCGAYLWRYNEMTSYKDEDKDVILKDKYFNFTLSKESSVYNGQPIDEKLFNLRGDIKNYLIKEFKNWATTYFANNIQSEFELRNNGKVLSAEEVKKLAIKMQAKPDTIFDEKTWVNGTKFQEDGYVNLEHYLTKNFDDNFFKNYISISHAYKSELAFSVKLFNRESSTAVSNVTEFLLSPSTTVKGIKYIFNNQMNYSLNVDNGYASQYITSFLNELRKQYKLKTNVSDNGNGFSLASDPNADENIKIALYKYCKLIYDRWVGGTKFEDWTLEKFYENHFYFIDAYYNKIGDIALINLDDIRDRMINSLTQSEYSLLSFMGDILAKNSFQLMCVQNFTDLSDTTQMKEMFKSIPYNDMKTPSIHPDFVVMYTYEPSHNLNIENSTYDDDGLVINSDDSQYWPDIIKGKDMNNGYTIPAFGVSYGSQYQSYFSNINVSMESPIVTEQSIKAQYLIAGQNSPNNGENGKGSVFVGQDLFTIYSNNSYTCTITMVGCAWVQPLMYFCLLNIPMFRGAYLIQKVTHHLEPGNMITTITGVRMCKTATPIMNKWILNKMNNESSAANSSQQGKLTEMKNKIASIDNDCEYKVFPTITIGEGGPVFDLQQLKGNTNLMWLERQGLKKDYKNLYEAIIATVGAEVGDGRSEGELGVKLVVVVMVNRLMGKKGNWEEVLRKGQTAVGVRNYADTKGFTNTVKWTEDVLTKGPMCIVGMTTEIPAVNLSNGMGPVLIKNLGIDTGKMSVPVKIDMNMVQKIGGYCTTNGYYRRVDTGALERFIDNDPKNGLYWWRSEYFLHHKGHVFTGMSSLPEKAHWTYVPKVSNNDKNKLSDTAQGLFTAIQQTVNSTENIKIDLTAKIGNNDNEMIITTSDTSNKNGKLASVFDVILNAYYNNFNKLFWVVNDKNDTILNNPHSIFVEVKDEKLSTTTNRSVAMVDKSYTTVGSFGSFNDKTDFSDSSTISPLFYRSLYKKYAPLGTKEAISIFNSEVKNFTSNNISVVNNLLNENKPSPCPVTTNSNGQRIVTDETQYTTVAPALDARGINATLYKKCLDTSVDKFKSLVGANWDNNFTLIGVRSNLNENGKTITNKYIDICVIIYDNGKKFLAPFTTVPGLTYLMNTNGKANPKGVSILQKGSYNVYKIDLHKKEYKALTQRSGKVTTFRDGDKDDKYNFINPSSGIFGINLHNNGSVDGVNVNDDSAGCQVFKRMKDFYFMMGLAVKSGKSTFNYTLINESDL